LTTFKKRPLGAIWSHKSSPKSTNILC